MPKSEKKRKQAGSNLVKQGYSDFGTSHDQSGVKHNRKKMRQLKKDKVITSFRVVEGKNTLGGKRWNFYGKVKKGKKRPQLNDIYLRKEFQ